MVQGGLSEIGVGAVTSDVGEGDPTQGEERWQVDVCGVCVCSVYSYTTPFRSLLLSPSVSGMKSHVSRFRIHVLLQLSPDVSTVLEQICYFPHKSSTSTDCTQKAVHCGTGYNGVKIWVHQRGTGYINILYALIHHHSCHVAVQRRERSQCTDMNSTIWRRNW